MLSKKRVVGFVVAVSSLLGGIVAPVAAEEAVDVGTAFAIPGGGGTFPVHFHSDSIIELTAALQMDIGYSQAAPIAANIDGKPDCTPSSEAGQNDMAFEFLPTGCSGSSCTQVRAIVVSFDDITTIPQGAELFTCKVSVPSGTAPGNYLLFVIEALGSDSLGYPVSISRTDGFVSVQSSGGC